LAKVTLGNERVSLSGAGSLWGMGPTANDLVDAVRSGGGATDPLVRQRIARVWAEGELLRLLRLRTVSAAVSGVAPGPEASGRKALADEHGQHVMALARDPAGATGMVPVARRAVELRVPLRPGADHRGRDVGGPAEHHRRAHAGSAPRPAALIRRPFPCPDRRGAPSAHEGAGVLVPLADAPAGI